MGAPQGLFVPNGRALTNTASDPPPHIEVARVRDGVAPTNYRSHVVSAESGEAQAGTNAASQPAITWKNRRKPRSVGRKTHHAEGA